MSDVVITGMGLISSLGRNVDECWEKVLRGETAVRRRNSGYSRVGEVLCAVMDDYQEEPEMKILHASLQAVKEALAMSNIQVNEKNTGLFVGTAAGIIPLIEKGIATPGSLDGNVDADVEKYYPYQGIAQFIEERLGCHFAKSLTFTAACASSSYAIEYATMLLRTGVMKQVIVLGAEVLSHYDLMGFQSLGILTNNTNCPFDARRDGIVLGESCAAIVLETMQAVEERTQRPLAMVKGIGISNEAYRLATPDPSGKGAMYSMNRALADAELDVMDIQYINAHGTGTKLNDSMETKAIKKVFGKQAYKIPVSSSKSILGHTRGASGATEAILCVKALNDQIIPATINYKEADPICDLDYVPNKSRYVKLENVMSNAFGFGGHCSTIILSKV